MKAALLVVAVLGLTHAPLQCGSKPDPARRMEDTAPEALWDLSERFEARGDREARRETLEQLVARYPSSRYAERAKVALDRSEDGGASARAEGAAPSPTGATDGDDGP